MYSEELTRPELLGRMMTNFDINQIRGSTIYVEGRIERFGNRPKKSGGFRQTIMLQDVIMAGSFVDHLWIDYTKRIRGKIIEYMNYTGLGPYGARIGMLGKFKIYSKNYGELSIGIVTLRNIYISTI